MGVALSSCTVPQAGRPTFSIDEGDMEIGMGIHGEPGVHRGPLKSANEIADALLDPILDDIKATPAIACRSSSTAWGPRRSRSCSSSTPGWRRG
jgi:dihydroxyacetone kinase